MPAYHVQRSILINAPAERVFDIVADFSTWPIWSPWLGIDKNATVTVTDDPRSVHSVYRWQGELVGAGEIEHVRLDRPSMIDDEIRFEKPFKSVSKVGFTLQPDRGATNITWSMQGNLPWFMFWMCGSMETYIGMDYERGLKMLREFIETGSVLSKTDVIGVESVEPMVVLGIHDSCPTEEVGEAMEKAFATVIPKLATDGIATDREMVSVYHPCNLKHRRFDFTSGYAVESCAQQPAGLARCILPSGNALHIRHTGSYENLGNSWSGAYQYARYKKLRIARRDAYEIYRNDPDVTPPAELVTDIYVPLK